MGAAKGEEFLQLLEGEGISIAELCRRTGLSSTTIRKYMKQARRARGEPEAGTVSFTQIHTPPKPSRNAALYHSRQRGLSWSQLARKFNVSPRRCQEIVRLERERRLRAKIERARRNGGSPDREDEMGL